MILSEEAFVMLLDEARFRDFTRKEICDTAASTEGIFALSASSRAEVDELVRPRPASVGRMRFPRWTTGSCRLELLRPRWAPLGGHLDGSEARHAVASPSARRRERR
jgi:hypothetical protein